MKTEMRLVLYFVANRDEELTFTDAAMKFGVPSRSVYESARRLATLGVLSLERQPRKTEPGKGQPPINMRAGPAILQALGSR